MKKIVIGKKNAFTTYIFRETCFGIVKKDDLYYITLKKNDYSLIGGGIENGESHEKCLRREFLEEVGLNIKSINYLCTVDCYWITRDKKKMNTLSNIYIVDVFDDELEPLEKESKLIKCNKDCLINCIILPYQVAGLNEYFKIVR